MVKVLGSIPRAAKKKKKKKKKAGWGVEHVAKFQLAGEISFK
jgi:hypothetical protein